MRQFDLKEWLDNKDMTLVTRDGKPVRIICWDAPNKAFPVVGFIEGSFSCYSWDPFGYYTTCHIKHKYDLFFECDKPSEFTEFERAFIEYSCHTEPEYLNEGHLKHKLEEAKKLYDIAKREIDTGFEPKFTYSEAVPAAREFNTEDLLNLNQTIYICHQHGYDAVEKWLKTLKDNYICESAKKTDAFRQQGEWTKEDDELYEKIYDCADFLLLKDSGVSEDRFIEWFDSLKCRLRESHDAKGCVPHNPDENIRYDMCFSDAQRYLSDRGLDTPWNDCDVFVDGRYITQSVANILAWADDNGKAGWRPTDSDIKDLEWCAELVKEKMGVGYHRLQVLIDELKSLAER